MGYYTRVFCTSKNKPTIKQVLEYITSQGYSVNGSIRKDERENVDEVWTQFELHYKAGKSPILVEYNPLVNPDDLANEEVDEFRDFIGKPKLLENKKKKVLKHLDKTSYVLCSQLPTSDIDDDGYEVNGWLLKFFEQNYEGLIQADGEGFYINNELYLKLE